MKKLLLLILVPLCLAMSACTDVDMDPYHGKSPTRPPTYSRY